MPGRVVAVSLILFFLFATVPVAAVQWVTLFGMLVIVASALWSNRTRKRLTVTRRDTVVSVFRFQKAEMQVEVRNGSIFPIAHLSVTDPCGRLRAEGRTSAVVSLNAGARMFLRYRIHGIMRGVHETGPLRVRGGDPLGLFPWYTVVGDTARITVYPALHPVYLPYRRGLPAGNLSTANPIYEDTTRFRSLRGYIRGDDPRRISWKATARTGELHTMEYLPALSFPLLILLNLRSDEYEIKRRYQAIERNIEAAAALVVYAQRLAQPVGLSVSGKVDGTDGEFGFPLASGYAHTVSLLRALATCSSHPGSFDVGAIQSAGGSIPYGTRIFYIGPALDAESVIALSGLAHGETTLDLLYTSRRRREHERFIPASVTIREIPEYGDFRFAG